MRWHRGNSMPPLELRASEVRLPSPAFRGEDHPWLLHGLSMLLAVPFLLLFDHMSDTSMLSRIEPFSLLLACALLIPIHELLHAIAHPDAGLSAETVMGFDRNLACPYCLYTRPYSRERAVIVALAPFVVLTLLPLVAFVIWESRPLLAYVATLNAGVSAFDLAGAAYAWKQLRPGEMIGIDRGRVVLVRNRSAPDRSPVGRERAMLRNDLSLRRSDG